jgi:hypothetical protein
MDVFERIDNLLTEQGKEQKQLYDYLGVSSQKYFDWKAGRLKSYTKYIGKIAEFFNVSIDYLLGNDDIKKRPTSEDIELLNEYMKNDMYRELMESVKRLSPESAAKVAEYAELLLASQKHKAD